LSDHAYLESDQHRRELIRHLRARRVPVRYLYAGSGARKHRSFAEDYADEYLDGRAEHEVCTMASVLDPAAVPGQFCEIGPSNGVHTAQVLDRLSDSGFPVTRYLGLDFSAQLIDAARSRLTSQLPEKAAFETWNMELRPTDRIEAWRGPGPVVVLLVGNTLGNVEDPAETLRNVFGSCREGDVLVLGLYVALPETADELPAYYSKEPIRDMILEPLRAAGLGDCDMTLTSRFVDDEVVVNAQLTRDVRPLGVSLFQGEELRCFRSRRFHSTDAREMLHGTGWTAVTHDVDASIGHMVVLAHRRASSSMSAEIAPPPSRSRR
jgi:L-histidine N-alpha-methyltransferase